VVDPLSDPGNIDITSDVDFEALAIAGSQIANGKTSFVCQISSLYFSLVLLFTCQVHFYGPISQRHFLYNMGIDVRATVGPIDDHYDVLCIWIFFSGISKGEDQRRTKDYSLVARETR
jgi:hypothetical protein